MRLTLCGGLAILCVVAGPAVAQPPGGQATAPPFSPYLNLARRGVSPAVNYFGIVRPQAQTAAAIQTLQQTANLPSPFAGGAAGGDQPVVTGNPYGFLNYRLYFQNQFTGGGFGNVAVGQTAGRQVPPVSPTPAPSSRRR